VTNTYKYKSLLILVIDISQHQSSPSPQDKNFRQVALDIWLFSVLREGKTKFAGIFTITSEVYEDKTKAMAG